MKKSWFYRILLLFLCLCQFAHAQNVNDLSTLKGNRLIYSSPYRDGNDINYLDVNHIALSPDFIDDGNLIINGKPYPIDQLFMKNKNDKYENLASIFNYNGIAKTYFIRYYDENRLNMPDEISRLRTQTQNCLQNYVNENTDSLDAEVLAYTTCLDNIFAYIVDSYYTKSAQLMHNKYQMLSHAMTDFSFAIISPDFCYGHCGTITQVKAYNQVLKTKQLFIFNILDNLSE